MTHQVPLDYRRIYWAREVAFNRMHPVPSQAQHGELELSTHSDSCHEKDATEEVGVECQLDILKYVISGEEVGD